MYKKIYLLFFIIFLSCTSNYSVYEKKGFGLLLEERELENKLYSLIQSIFNDKMLIKKILSNQKQYSDKDIFKNLNILIKNILNFYLIILEIIQQNETYALS